MKKRIVAILLALALLLLAALTVGGVNFNHLIFGNPEFDPTQAPKEAIQRSWRLPSGDAHLQYTYTAPNACWNTQGEQTLVIVDDTAVLTIVPKIETGQCAAALVPLTYDQELKIPTDIEILKVIVEHPFSGAIETNELWIEPQEEEIIG